MTVAAVGTPATVVQATAGSVTGAYGTGQNATSGNLLVARVTAIAGTSTTAISTPSGWTKRVESFTAAGQVRTAIYYCFRGASAQAAPTFTSTVSGTGTRMTCFITEYSGADTLAPIQT